MDRRLTRRASRQAVLAAIARREWLLQILALGVAGCRRGSGDRAYARGNTLVMAGGHDNGVVYNSEDFQSLYCVHLATTDYQNGNLQPELAESWEQSDDYQEATYHLRRDVHWSDGVPVTAQDVKFTLDLLNDADVLVSKVDEVTVIDDYTVKVRRRAGAGPDQLAWVWHLPKHVLEHLDPKEFHNWDFWWRPTVSAGPYRFVRYVPETMMEFEANPKYFRGKPKIERVVYKFVGDAGVNELLSGNVDITGADAAQIPQLANDPRFRVYQSLNQRGMAIYWKCDHPLFRDARVRRALTLAIDRQELLGLLNLPSDLPITDGIFTDRQFRRRQFSEPLPYDPVQARALLEAAGWQDRDGDVRKQAGRPFRFTAIVPGTLRFDRLAVDVQAQLRKVGVLMEILVLDNLVVKHRLSTGDFEAAFRTGYGPMGRNNSLGYQNSEAFRLTDQAMATADPDEQDRIYEALTEIFRADLPVTRLVPLTNTTFAHRRVRGLMASQIEMVEDRIGDMSLEKER